MSLYIHHQTDNRWEVRSSENEDSCFVGSLDACRDWLDCCEGQQQQTFWSYLKSHLFHPAETSKPRPTEISKPDLSLQKQESWS